MPLESNLDLRNYGKMPITIFLSVIPNAAGSVTILIVPLFAIPCVNPPNAIPAAPSLKMRFVT